MIFGKKCECGPDEQEHVLKKPESAKLQLSNHSRPPGSLPKLFDNIFEKFGPGKMVCKECDCKQYTPIKKKWNFWK